MVIQEQMFGYSAVQVPPRGPARRRSRASGASLVRPTLQEALAPYLDVERLEEILVARGRSEISLGNLQLALKGGSAPPELQAMLTVLAAAMRPPEQRKQIKSPADAAALLMVEMGMLDLDESGTLPLSPHHLSCWLLICFQNPRATSAGFCLVALIRLLMREHLGNRLDY